MQQQEEVFEVILIGDSGNIKRNQPDELIEMIKAHLPTKTNSAVVFLGDNIYPKGLPPENDPLRADAEKVVQIYHQSVENFPGQVYFISGNHDWNKGKEDGIEYVLRQEKYIQKLFHQPDVFIPENGCPGPKEINLDEDLVMIAINTQWWIQKGFRPIGAHEGCGIEHEEDFFTQLEEILERNKHKRILIIGHYPIYSYSLHGGRYKFKHHLFPLTLYKKRAYLPIPFLGSLLPLYRKYFGAREDLSHPRFKILRKRLKEIFRKYPGLIYAAGHEHNLQFIEKYQNNYIISGAASKATYVLDSKHSRFGISAKGFFKIKFYKENKAKAEAWIVEEGNKKGELVYEGWML
nr:metallophosphoesterase [Pseudopedobacter sp.]